MVLVAWEQHTGKLIQTVDTGNLIVVQFDLGAWHIFHPCLFGQNWAFERVLVFLADVKTFSGQSGQVRKDCDCPKTVRFRGILAQQGRFMATEGFGDRFPGLARLLEGDLVGGQIPLQ